MNYSTCCPKCGEALAGMVHEGVPKIESMADVMELLDSKYALRKKKKEYLIGIYLDARQQVIKSEIISIGTLTASLAHPREIFAPAIADGVAGIIVAHNHPSGDPSPSNEDERLTKRIADAGRILGIELLDHVIIGEQGTYSFKTSGQL